MANNETEQFKDKIEVSLDGRQIFYLFFGSAVIATLVFVLGVMVGRRVEQKTTAENHSLVRDPLAALDKIESSGQLAFPAALRGVDVPLGSVDSKLALAEQGLNTTALAVGSSAKEEKSLEAKVLKVEEEKQKPADDEKVDREKKPVKKTVPVEEKPAVEKPKAKGEVKETAEEEKPLPKKDAKTSGRRFTLQVGSFKDKEEADVFFRKLEGSAYQPYMVEAEVAGKGKYFRVRVGGYNNYDDAVAAKTQFEDKQHVIAYVTRLK